MQIKNDFKYLHHVDELAIEEGVAKTYIQFVWLTYDPNLITKEMAEEKIKAFMEQLNDYKIYQYNYDKNDYDLFFWSYMHDMSYIQLSSENADMRNKLVSLVESVKNSDKYWGIVARLQYAVDYDDCQLMTIANKFYEINKDRFINLDRGVFKVKLLDAPYVYNDNQQKRFFIMEKGRRKYGRYADDKDMYAFSKGIYNYGLFS